VAPKWQFLLDPLTLSNINRFSKFFHCRNQKICSNIITKDPTTPQLCRYTTLWNVRKTWFGWCVKIKRMGKTDIVFVEPGAKVNGEYYCLHVLGGGLLPDTRARCQRYSWTLQQDGAPSHTARNTHTDVPAAWEPHVHRAWHVAPKQLGRCLG